MQVYISYMEHLAYTKCIQFGKSPRCWHPISLIPGNLKATKITKSHSQSQSNNTSTSTSLSVDSAPSRCHPDWTANPRGSSQSSVSPTAPSAKFTATSVWSQNGQVMFCFCLAISTPWGYNFFFCNHCESLVFKPNRECTLRYIYIYILYISKDIHILCIST